MTVLSKASSQWNSRPADERFWTVGEMHSAVAKYRQDSRTASVAPSTLSLVEHEGKVQLVGKTGTSADLTAYSFGQLARLGGAPAGYLQTLPAALAADCANHALHKRSIDTQDSPMQLLFNANGNLQLRAATSESYTRIWNETVTNKLRELSAAGWRVPPAMPTRIDGVETRIATADDCGPYTLVKVGDSVSPSGLYASDRDLFAFMINPDRQISAGGHGGRALFRGFFCWNSEVGDRSFGLQTFLFDFVCFNHNVWGAEQVSEVRVRHVGRAMTAVQDSFDIDLRKFTDGSAADDEQKIQSARRFMIASTPENVINVLFNNRSFGIPRKTLELAQTIATQNTDAYGDPRSAWGMAQGLTEVSQRSGYASERVSLDRAAGRVVAMAF